MNNNELIARLAMYHPIVHAHYLMFLDGDISWEDMLVCCIHDLVYHANQVEALLADRVKREQDTTSWTFS